MFTVYLAGGFKSGWQEKVKRACSEASFADPSKCAISQLEEYTPYDFMLIRQSDVIFAYLEDSNPKGYALALEIGYAKALGKMIILVNEKSGLDGAMNMVESSCDVVYKNLNEGISYLEQLGKHSKTMVQSVSK